jgi:hypothetical protein
MSLLRGQPCETCPATQILSIVESLGVILVAIWYALARLFKRHKPAKANAVSPVHILFPSDPLSSRAVDPAFAAELQAARSAGFETSLINSEALDAGEFNRAIRVCATAEREQLAMYRGWMLGTETYAGLFAALSYRNWKLCNDAAQYRHTHHLPESYAAIREHTPLTVWTTTGPVFDGSAIAQLLAPFGNAPLVVKDYVKSQKHYWDEACFIPRASDLEAVRRVANRFIELQAESLVGGLVFREFVPLRALAAHAVSGMPLTQEYRIFMYDGIPLITAEYWEQGAYDGEGPPADLFIDVAKQVQSRFFSMDVARRADGAWMIVELGDGQVAGIPERLPADAFYAALATRMLPVLSP